MFYINKETKIIKYLKTFEKISENIDFNKIYVYSHKGFKAIGKIELSDVLYDKYAFYEFYVNYSNSTRK